MESARLSLFYFQITDVWKRHCELHAELFDLTCDEYALLLNSDLDALEDKVAQKNNIVSLVKENENIRSEVIQELKEHHPSAKLDSISDVIKFFATFEAEKKDKHLERFNNLLLDIIGKIQDQNKKNQIFINKAILSLREIRETATGKTSVHTYNAKGVSQSHTLAKNP